MIDSAHPDPRLARVTLVRGPEAFLAERAVADVAAAVREAATAADEDSDLTEAPAAELTPAALAELTSPSLFASRRVVVVRDVQDADDALGAALVEAVTAVADACLVLVHTGGGGGKGASLARRLGDAGARTVVCERLTRADDLVQFVRGEATSAGGRCDEEAARALVDAVGTDLRALAAAVAQLVSDSGGHVTRELVETYFEGRAEVKSFAVADRAVEGATPRAVEELRWALEAGVAPVLVSSALASALRNLVRLRSVPRGTRDSDVARDLGVPAWKLRTLRQQSRGWSDEGLAAAVQAVARADADVKGASNDVALALSRAVLAVGEARRAS